jgi:uncharacterized protein
MEIQRSAYAKLLDWKKSPNRKPLILQGARQVGKTWLIKRFGKSEFESIAYFNFEESAEIRQFFAETKDVQRIIRNLALVYGKPILPGKTLLVFDEIQECAEALNSLKYFNENAPEYDIICAGSLLGVALARGSGFPVGKTDFLYLYPVSFSEFLAIADKGLSEYLNLVHEIEPIPDVFFNSLLEYFKMYFISGGMPEAVMALIEKKDVELTQQVLRNILMAYSLDFSKHVPNKDIPKINHVWQSLPSQLARENKKFLYQLVKTGARAREYEDALLWLQQAGLVHKVNCCTKPALPLNAYQDLSSFKLYALDVGLLRRLSFLDPVAVKEGNRLFTEFKGALSENYVLQSLVPQYESLPHYWTSGNTAEVDFLVQHNNEIIPVEVKSDNSVTGKSLTFYNKQHAPKLRVRFSLKNLKLDDGLLNIPLFMADQTRSLIDRLI